jgi:hypothetical protein
MGRVLTEQQQAFFYSPKEYYRPWKSPPHVLVPHALHRPISRPFFR